MDVTFDDLKIDVSGKTEVDGSGDGPVDESKAAVTVQGGDDATIELDGDNKLKSGSCKAGLEKDDEMSEDGETISGKLTIKDDNDTKGSLTAEGGDGGGAGIGGGSGENRQQHHHPGRHDRGCGWEQRGRHRRRCRPRVGDRPGCTVQQPQ
ncbi:MAG: hypothetical protein ACLTGJ_00430 [Faecalibacterium prausnitzii]